VRLCLLVRLYPPLIGGPATVASQLSSLLTERDVEVFVVTQHMKGLPYHEERDQVKIFRIPVIAPPWVSTHNTLRLTSGVFSLAYKTMDVAHKYDIQIIDVLDVSVAGLAGLMISLISDRKLLLKYGGDLVFEYLSLKRIRACDENWNVEESWKVKDLRGKLLYWIEQQYVKSYDLLLPDSYYGAELLRKLGAEEEKIRVIPNGVDTKLFSPTVRDPDIERRVGLKRPVILAAGRLVPWKGLNYLVEASPAIIRVFPSATFLIIGDGPERNNLEKQVEELRLTNNFIFGGRIPHQDIADIFSCIDIFVLPSLFDTTPNVLLEVMSSGKPVIASDIEGIREVVKNNETGILVPPADVKSLEKALLELLTNPKKATRIGGRAREFIEKYYSLEITAERLLEIFEGLSI